MNLKNYIISLKQYLDNRSTCNELRKYKNIHKGERCFIIGTGPSLTTEDLEKLKDEVTFGSNRIFEIFPQTDWRPTYYMNQDYQLICKFADDIKNIVVKRKFMPIEAKRFFEDSNDISYFVLRYKEYYPKDADFSKHLDKYMGQGFTVTYGAIQMAYYMGFSEVYLLGIDHNYSISLNEKGVPVLNEGTQDYFKGSKASNKGLNLPRVVESTVAYMTARKFADSHSDFAVYNATRGGKLEAFSRVDLDEVLKKS
ncbi:MAG: 6-hydroxymethylpterin diphosphokinase MptE-like protein [Acutalibacteraceae bacterium]